MSVAAAASSPVSSLIGLRRRQRAYGHAFTALFILIWGVYATQIPIYVLPGPLRVAERLVQFFTTYSLAIHAWSSLMHVLAAIALAFVVGLALALLAYYVPVTRFAVHQRLSPAFNAFPGIGWIMLAVLWFGVNHETVIFSIAVVLLPFVLINLREGLDSLSAETLEMGRSFTRRGGRHFFLIVLPSLYPFMFATLRICFGVAWKITLTAELFGGRAGLGYLFNHARQVFDTSLIVAIIVIIIAFVYATDRWLFEPVQRRLEGQHGGG